MSIIKTTNINGLQQLLRDSGKASTHKDTPLLNNFQSVMESKWKMRVTELSHPHASDVKASPVNTGPPTFIKAIAAQSNEEISVHERAVALRAYRTQLLASNIANADTPNYKAVDINVNEALKQEDQKVSTQYSIPSQANLDGNTVEMDNERTKFAKNALMYEYSIGQIKEHYQGLDELLKNLPY